MEKKKKLPAKKTTVTANPLIKEPVAKKAIAKPARTAPEVIKKEVKKPLTKEISKKVTPKVIKPKTLPLKKIENKLPSKALEIEQLNIQLDSKEIEKTLEPKNTNQFNYFDQVSEAKNVLAMTHKFYPQLLLNGYLYNLTLYSQYQQYLINKALKNMEYLATSLNNSKNFLKK